jgi:hypothetical protein
MIIPMTSSVTEELKLPEDKSVSSYRQNKTSPICRGDVFINIVFMLFCFC